MPCTWSSREGRPSWNCPQTLSRLAFGLQLLHQMAEQQESLATQAKNIYNLFLMKLPDSVVEILSLRPISSCQLFWKQASGNVIIKQIMIASIIKTSINFKWFDWIVRIAIVIPTWCQDVCNVLLLHQSFSLSLFGKSVEMFEDYEDDDENDKDDDNIPHQNLFPNALGDDTGRLPIWMECKIYDIGIAMRVRENAQQQIF